MIKPHPESDIRLNIMVLGSEIISILNSKVYKDRYVLVENILSEFLKRDTRRTPDLFLYALIFLYSVGLLEYKGYKIILTPSKEEQLDLFHYHADKTLF
jgi:hypothetical protein